MKAFKQLISLLYKDPRHQSWCFTVQAGIWLRGEYQTRLEQTGRNSTVLGHSVGGADELEHSQV